jgi:hypothetical protein
MDKWAGGHSLLLLFSRGEENIYFPYQDVPIVPIAGGVPTFTTP